MTHYIPAFLCGHVGKCQLCWSFCKKKKLRPGFYLIHGYVWKQQIINLLCSHTCLCVFCTSLGLTAISTRWHIRAESFFSVRFPCYSFMFRFHTSYSRTRICLCSEMLNISCVSSSFKTLHHFHDCCHELCLKWKKCIMKYIQKHLLI